MRDFSTTGLGDQPPRPPRALEQIPLQELHRPVPEDVLPPVIPPQKLAELPIDIDNEDMQPPDHRMCTAYSADWRTGSSLARFSYARFHTLLKHKLARTSLTCTSLSLTLASVSSLVSLVLLDKGACLPKLSMVAELAALYVLVCI